MISVEISIEPVYLQLIKKEILSDTTFVHQIANGTTFYRRALSILINDNEQKVEGMLVGGSEYSIMATQNNAVYYGSNWKRKARISGVDEKFNKKLKIYKAELNGTAGIIETCEVRDLSKDEIIHLSGLCSIVIGGQVFVYGMADDPIQDRILVDVPEKTLESIELKGVFGNTVIFRELSHQPIEPTVEKLGSNAIVLKCYRGTPRRFLEIFNVFEDMAAFNSPWGSSAAATSDFVYMSNGESLFVIDPLGATLLPPLKFLDVSSFYIGGVRGGTVTGRGKCTKTGKFHLLTAQLPTQYVVNPEVARVLAEQAIATALSQKTSATTQEPTFSSRFLNDYEFDRVLGKGGFGCVFKVVSKVDKAEYAIKRITKIAIRKEDALKEAEKMVRLEHPGIVRYFTAWIEEPPPGWQDRVDYEKLRGNDWRDEISGFKHNDVFIYIPMKLCKCSLEDWLKENQDASSRNRILIKSWFKDIVSAVQYLHTKDIIHCDLKPGNILIDENDDIKLCDFGIATERVFANNTEVTATRDAAASPIYASPEQISGFFTRFKSMTDIFPLGLIFAELCIIFNSYRYGSPRDGIFEDVETANFVALLANVKPENRPTCKEILEHSFLAN